MNEAARRAVAAEGSDSVSADALRIGLGPRSLRRRVGIFAHQRDRRNLTPDQLALVMGRHYNRVKLSMEERGKRAAAARAASPEKQERPSPHGQADRLAEMYGVGHDTIAKAGKFAAAVETLKAVDPDTEERRAPLEGDFRVTAAWGAPCGVVEATPRRYPGDCRAPVVLAPTRHGGLA